MYFKKSEVIYPAIALIILLLITIFSYQDWREFQRATSDTAETQNILQTSENLLAAMTEAETGQRGFILTGEERYLDPYNSAIKEIPGLLNELDRTTQHYRSQYDPVSSLKALVPEKLEEMRHTIAIRREEDGFTAALRVVQTNQGKQAMQQIREKCKRIEAEEYGKLRARSEAAASHGKRTRLISTVGSALLVIFLVLSSGALSRAMQRRDQAISELLESKRQTEQIRDLLKTTLTSIADAVVASDLNGKIAFINPVALELTGWIENEAIDQPIGTVCRLVDEGTEEQIGDLVKRALRDDPGEPNLGVVLISKGGRRTAVDERGAPLRNGQGEVIGAVLVFRDITGRKQAEHALVRSNEDMQQFAYAASHDLKTPLRTVTNFAQLLEARYRDRLDSDANEFIGFIVNAARHMGQLLDALLEYSRSGEVIDKPRRLEGADVLESALANLRAEIAETGAVITHGPLPALVIDELHLRQLFQNLIGNAIKYRSNQKPQVHVAAERSGEDWTFSVQDNGMGIEPRHHDRIFGVFKRLHGPEYPGAGIGLATCRRVVERCGGRIWVESTPGQGSTFFFTLPAQARERLRTARYA
ncbi:MAG: CHASE3 domain-containing protein [Acidobacteriota bacterium]|nr:CHASE3 domain-containing protein [Acidobacteriota bacterium]